MDELNKPPERMIRQEISLQRGCCITGPPDRLLSILRKHRKLENTLFLVFELLIWYKRRIIKSFF